MPVTEHDLEGALLAERPWLVGLCLRFTGNREMAEDLIQDTLLEAWRQAHKLHDSQGLKSWLSAIARNVCLRWARRHSQSVALLNPIECGDEHRPVPLHEHPDSDIALEAVLERRELALLLDRALAALPATTRAMLVAHYIDEVPQGEIAARWGVSDTLVKARVHRGKQALRRILNTDFREDAAAYGLVDSNDWQDTRVWCPYCGQRRLRGCFSTLTFMLSCPQCAVTQERRSMVAYVNGRVRKWYRVRWCPARCQRIQARSVPADDVGGSLLQQRTTSFESITTHAVLDVVSAADTLELLEVHRPRWS